MKLLKLISESILEKTDADMQSDLTNMFKSDYKTFVSQLGTFATDSKFRKFIASTPIQKSTVKKIAIPVRKLIPTQNEVVLDKSLKYPLTVVDSATVMLNGGVVLVAAPIITFNGRYIIDGHHRWSQLYAMNKDAKIVAFDFSNDEIRDPKDALKLIYLAIVGTGVTKLKKSEGGGINLFKMSGPQLSKFVTETITDEVRRTFNEIKQLKDDASIIKYLWNNIASLRITSKPIKGAPPRPLMPQADTAPTGQVGTINRLKSGVKVPQKTNENMKLTTILRLNEARLLKDNNHLSLLIKTLNEEPAYYLVEKLNQIISKMGGDYVGFDDYLRLELEALYKNADKKAAKLIESAIESADDATMKSKNEKLDTIKKKVVDIQDSLKKESKKPKKKK